MEDIGMWLSVSAADMKKKPYVLLTLTKKRWFLPSSLALATTNEVLLFSSLVLDRKQTGLSH